MKHSFNTGRKLETICIDRIELGINSIKSGRRSGDEVGKDLEYFFNKLEKSNKPMYEDLYVKYCLARLEKEQSKDMLTVDSLS